jgi:hypothetical protein
MVTGFVHARHPVEAIDQITLAYLMYRCNMLVVDRNGNISAKSKSFSLFHWSLDALARGFRGISIVVLLTYETEG